MSFYYRYTLLLDTFIQEFRRICCKINTEVIYLTQTSDGGERGSARAVATRARELDVAGEVRYYSVSLIAHAADTVRTTVDQTVAADEQLDLAENAASGEQSLAVVTQNNGTSRSKECRHYVATCAHSTTGIDVGGDEGERIRAIVLVERSAQVANVDIIAKTSRDLLDTSLE